MADIIGREDEVSRLQRFLSSKKAEFLAIYGRRRVGKTFLIQKFYSSSNAISFHVTGIKDGSMKEQIVSFTRVIGKTFYDGVEIQYKTNWLDVFEQLTEAIEKTPKNKKVILFFDELPWMATKRSKLIQAIDHYWNRYWSINPRVKFIVCGSAASWMLDNLINNKGGLYNRVTYQIELSAFTLKETKQFLIAKDIHLNHQQLLKLYMAIGGIPLYLDHVEKGLSADENIDQLCFSKRGLLFNEFARLFASLFKSYEVSEELIRIIAQHRYGISQMELMQRSSKKIGGRLKKRLKELEDAGFVESFVPYQHKARGICYRVIDEYTLFYLKWIEPVLSSVKRRDKEKGYWLSKQKSHSFESWAGYAYESICYRHVSQIRKALNIDPGAEFGSWRYAAGNQDEVGAQIDLLFDRDDDAITLCEIKYTAMPYLIDKNYAKNLMNKIKIFQKKTGTKKQLFLAMVTANGIKENLYSDELISSVVCLDDLFNAD